MFPLPENVTDLLTAMKYADEATTLNTGNGILFPIILLVIFFVSYVSNKARQTTPVAMLYASIITLFPMVTFWFMGVISDIVGISAVLLFTGAIAWTYLSNQASSY